MEKASTGDVLVGVDIVSIRRFKRLLQRFDMHFKKQIFTTYELETYGQSIHRLASRYAAKEATSKALQVGLAHMSSSGIPARDIEVRTQANGAPILQLYGLAQELAIKNHIKSIKISISHEQQFAIAMVTALCS